MVTENFLKYIKEDVLKFRLLGFPDVKKQPDAAAAAAAKKKGALKAAAI